MDIKDVSIKDLFADIKTSFTKLEQQKQKLIKEERRRELLNKKRHIGGCNKVEEEGLLFPSMVNPNWNSNDSTTAVAADEMPSSSELPSKQQIHSDKSSEQPPTVASSSLPPPLSSSKPTATTTKPKKTMAESILDLLAAHNSTSSITTTSTNTTTHSLPTKNNNISEAELKRRRDIEISIRNKSKQIIQENERLSKLKPLEFNKPTFKLPQDKTAASIKQGGQEGRDGSGSTSSLSSLGKKRKASSITTSSSTATSLLRCYTGTSTNPTSISNNNCFQLQQLGSNRNHSGIYAASSSALPPPSKPITNPYEATAISGSSGGSGLDGGGIGDSGMVGIMGGYFVPYGSNRRYTQEEVRGLVDFAHEWITPDFMKRRRI